MRYRHLFGIAAVSLAMILSAGCNPRDAGNLAQDTRKIAQDTGQAFGSMTLAGKVEAVLSVIKNVNVTGMHVEAQDGVVTLNGHVASAAERRRVVHMVNQIRGVDRIVDNLRIQP
jgi:hyperosmotically inducible protein